MTPCGLKLKVPLESAFQAVLRMRISPNPCPRKRAPVVHQTSFMFTLRRQNETRWTVLPPNDVSSVKISTFLLLQTKWRWNNPTWKIHIIIQLPDICLSDLFAMFQTKTFWEPGFSSCIYAHHVELMISELFHVLPSADCSEQDGVPVLLVYLSPVSWCVLEYGPMIFYNK